MSEGTVTPPAAPAATPPAASSDWTSGFDADTKGYIQNKGFKDPGSVIESYRNFEKLMGAPKERILKVPEKAEDVEGWNGIYQKLGRPEKPEGYKFEMKDQEFGKWAQGTFHELGLSESQAAKLVGKWNEYANGVSTKQQESYANKISQEGEALKKEWGAAYDQNIAQAKRAVQGLGLDGEKIDALEKVMGFAGVMKFVHSLGTKLGEDSFVSGDSKSGGFGAMTPEAAMNRINAIKADKSFVEKYLAGDLAARQEMERLHKFAYPGT